MEAHGAQGRELKKVSLKNSGKLCCIISCQFIQLYFVILGVKEYLEIDFVREHRITQTETQGRYGNGMGVEYAENFQLEYWRDSLSRWVPYKDHLGRTVRHSPFLYYLL